MPCTLPAECCQRSSAVALPQVEAAQQTLSSAWDSLQEVAQQSTAAFGEVVPPSLPSWVKTELEARLKPHCRRFPGQELVVRPIRRALAWRRAGKLVSSSSIADMNSGSVLG